MKARIPRFLSAFSLLLAAVLSLAQNALSQDAPTQDELDAITAAIESVQASIENTSSQRGRVEAQLLAAEREISELNASIAAVEQQINAERSQLETLRSEQSLLEESKADQQEVIAQYLRGAWQSGREEYLKLLLNQEDIAGTARMIRYYQYFNQARAEKIAVWNQTLDDLARVESEVLATTASLEQNQRQLSVQRNELEASRQQRQRILTELEQTLEESGQELARLEQQRAEITLLIEELNRSLRNLGLDSQQQPFEELRGQLPWPAEGRLMNSFGSRQSQGDLTWQGVNIRVEAGTQVRAIHHGRVVYADWFGSSGLLLIIDHGDGYMSLYAQNEQLFHGVGDWVGSGEVIATAGNTGGQSETGLYFEIRHQGRSQDPVAWCIARN